MCAGHGGDGGVGTDPAMVVYLRAMGDGGGNRLGRISRLGRLGRGLRRPCGLKRGGGPPTRLRGRVVPFSGFSHGFEAGGEGLLKERMRRRRGVYLQKEKKKGGGGGGLFMELGC